MKSRKIAVLPIRTVRDTIREEERHDRRRRLQAGWRWLVNQPVVILAWIITMAVVLGNWGWQLASGGNGLVFTVTMAAFIGLVLGLLQLRWREVGYTIKDWAYGFQFRGKHGM